MVEMLHAFGERQQSVLMSQQRRPTKITNKAMGGGKMFLVLCSPNTPKGGQVCLTFIRLARKKEIVGPDQGYRSGILGGAGRFKVSREYVEHGIDMVRETC